MSDRTLVSVLRFDERSYEPIDAAVRSIHRRMGRSLDAPPDPHVSLVPAEIADVAGRTERLALFLREKPPIELTMSFLGLFPSGVLFLGATVTQPVLAFHRGVFDVLQPDVRTPWIDLYRPGAWIPHCTLAMNVSQDLLQPVIAEAKETLPLPHVARCSSLDLLQVLPGVTRTVATWPLCTT